MDKRVEAGDRVIAEGYGEVQIVQRSEFDSICQILLPNGETAWTDTRMVKPLDK